MGSTLNDFFSATVNWIEGILKAMFEFAFAKVT